MTVMLKFCNVIQSKCRSGKSKEMISKCPSSRPKSGYYSRCRGSANIDYDIIRAIEMLRQEFPMVSGSWPIDNRDYTRPYMGAPDTTPGSPVITWSITTSSN